MKKLVLLALCVIMSAPLARADEGMWLPCLIGERIKDMRSKGFKLSAEDIYSVNKASMKDAIVKFGRGCTGELISDQGLLLTNHHCGYGEIQSHSTVEHDYLTNGFWAMNKAEELPNPGLEVSFLVYMEDVTDRVLAGITDTATEEEVMELKKKNIEDILDRATEGNHYRAAVSAFYYGNQYFLFVSEVFTDVRLVAAPPSSIGKFGGDTDNWMWPRHTGDFSMFRIYADRDNKPADYSPDNVPYAPKKYFTVSTKGFKEGDFTMVYGFPGSTQQFITSDAVDYVLNMANPLRIDLRTQRLSIIEKYQAQDPAVRIAYAAKHANIANGWKKWQGESLGLRRLGTIAKKQRFEREFESWAADKPEYRTVVADLAREYRDYKDMMLMRDLYNETIGAMELPAVARTLWGGKYEKDDPIPGFLARFYRNYNSETDREISGMLLEYYFENTDPSLQPEGMAREIAAAGGYREYIDSVFLNSALNSERMMIEVFLEGLEDNVYIGEDPVVQFAVKMDSIYRERINGDQYAARTKRVNDLYVTYVRGMMEYGRGYSPAGLFFPDANLTLRVAYGAVDGYTAQDAVSYKYVSTIEGIMQKDDPTVYDYDIPQRLRDIYASKDYGRWAVNGTVPVCFLATNHTTGGNSGSPVVNGRGELIGINFDRTWLSTMSDIEFDPLLCRNVAMDIRYLLFVIDKIGGAGYLIDEMKLK